MDKPWVDDDTPLISPDARFRQELARALQDSYQRQQIARQLQGGRTVRHRRSVLWLAVATSGAVTLLVAVSYYLRRRGRPAA